MSFPGNRVQDGAGAAAPAAAWQRGYALGVAVVALAAGLLAPLLAPALLRREVRFRLRERLGGYAWSGEAPLAGRLWIHAASVGEVKAALLLAERLVRLRPGLNLVFTVTSMQGYLMARRALAADTPVFMAPLDLPWLAGRAIKRLCPAGYVCMETELWPGMLGGLQRRGVPVALMNARLSERSLRGYARLRGLIGPLLAGMHAVCAVSQEDARRLRALGAGQVEVSGNIKYDAPPPGRARLAEFRSLLGLQRRAGRPVLVCGSIRSGEEEVLARVARRLARRHPGLLWIVAPRHPRSDRLAAVEAALARNGWAWQRLGALGPGGLQPGSAVLVDTMGDLAVIYGLATVAFCGGSLVPRGGHNLMEPAAWGVPVAYGPHVEDFQDAALLLEEAGAGFRAEDGDALERILDHLLGDGPARGRAGQQAAAVAQAQQGAASCQAGAVLAMLEGETGAQPGQ